MAACVCVYVCPSGVNYIFIPREFRVRFRWRIRGRIEARRAWKVCLKRRPVSREVVEELRSTSIMTEGDFVSLVLSSVCFLRISSSIFLFEFEIYPIETWYSSILFL